MKKGFSTTELIIAVALILLVGGAVIWAALDTRRRSRDVARLSDVRTVQAALEEYRLEHASYPTTLEAVETSSRTPMEYVVQPQGCDAAGEALCSSYTLRFELEGAVGTVRGGSCAATRSGMTCSP